MLSPGVREGALKPGTIYRRMGWWGGGAGFHAAVVGDIPLIQMWEHAHGKCAGGADRADLVAAAEEFMRSAMSQAESLHAASPRLTHLWQAPAAGLSALHGADRALLERTTVIPLDRWRGSVVQSDLGPKVVFAFSPRYLLSAFTDLPYFRFDVARAVEQSRYPELRLTPRVGILRPTLSQVVDFLSDLRRNHIHASSDIEGYPDDRGITMLSICPDPTSGIVIPFWIGGDHYWSASEELIVWQYLSAYYADASCTKTFHNGFYESFVLAWKHRCLICGWTDDTMLKFWELYPELEKNLGVVNSFCTLEPYYKDDRESNNLTTKTNFILL
jgi:hypothetical protein